MRHLVILDFRAKSNFDQSHIRGSMNVDFGSYSTKLIDTFRNKQGSHFQGDDLRRVIFIFPVQEAQDLLKKTDSPTLNEVDSKIFEVTGGLDHIHKAYYLSDYS